MKLIPKTALTLVSFLLAPAEAGPSDVSTGSFKNTNIASLGPNEAKMEFYTVMEETGKLSMYLKVSVDAIQFIDS